MWKNLYSYIADCVHPLSSSDSGRPVRNVYADIIKRNLIKMSRMSWRNRWRTSWRFSRDRIAENARRLLHSFNKLKSVCGVRFVCGEFLVSWYLGYCHIWQKFFECFIANSWEITMSSQFVSLFGSRLVF